MALDALEGEKDKFGKDPMVAVTAVHAHLFGTLAAAASLTNPEERMSYTDVARAPRVRRGWGSDADDTEESLTADGDLAGGAADAEPGFGGGARAGDGRCDTVARWLADTGMPVDEAAGTEEP